jgi:hypothetical protein
MTVRMARHLLALYPKQDQEIGFDDGEGHWCQVVGLRQVRIEQAYFNDADGDRECCEIVNTYILDGTITL